MHCLFQIFPIYSGFNDYRQQFDFHHALYLAMLACYLAGVIGYILKQKICLVNFFQGVSEEVIFVKEGRKNDSKS